MKRRVLFLCVHNSARSQIAEGLLRRMAGEFMDVSSAGSQPSAINPFAVRVLQDRGIDASMQYAKNVQDFLTQSFDYVITLCEDEVCPVFPGAGARLHWGMPDPSAVEGDTDTRLDAFRETADAIQARLDEFVQTMLQPTRMRVKS